MGENGGKAFSLPKARKPALKTTVSKGGGKDNSTTKGKVQFDTSSDSEGSPTPRANNHKSSKSSGREWGKGGKGDKSGKGGGKSSAPKGPAIPELNIESELPNNAKCLMDCEAAVLLQGIEEQLVILSKDSIKLPAAFDKGLQYAKGSNHYKSSESVRQLLQTLRAQNVSDGEICLIANVCPETADEVYGLMPSLKANRFRTEGLMKSVLPELAKLKSD